ncbi:MAG: hypothetical protein EA376_14605 [Phycisphaeraceae bacterium]|nr:MAG: hypothetical protein EA376_14605 [Phycisphaeraceae bacterium]
MALFGKKKETDQADDAASTEDAGRIATESNGDEKGLYKADAAKAARFFEHARTVHETGNHEYAMTLWLQGLRQDPTSFTGLEQFWQSALEFRRTMRKPGPTRDQSRSFDGKGPVERFLVALLNWGTRPGDTSAGVKAVETSVKLGLAESAYWIGDRVLGASLNDRKPKKDHYVRLKDLFSEIQAFDLAVKAGNLALNVDPTDSPLEAELRNLSAQAAMTKGGYEETGQEGGFRKNIRDADTQRRIQDESSLAKGEDAATRLLSAAKEDYDSRPTDNKTIAAYARRLLETNNPEHEKLAYQVLIKGYEDTKEFRFRQQAGDVKLRRARRKLRQLRDAAAEKPDDEKLQATLKDAERKFIEMEIEELTLCVDAYPTDLSFKYQLGRRHFLLGQYEKAIEFFQEAQNDAKSRVQVLNYLGQSFLALGWHTEAVESLRSGIKNHPSEKDDLGLELRYGLMRALEAKARAERDTNDAEEAMRLASGIAMQQISFRDIRERRDELRQLVQELKTASG